MRQTVTELEEIFYNVIHSDFPHDWDENRVTFNLMKELKNFFTYKIINYSNFSKTVQWESYKNRGTVENFFGDISIIFNIQFTTREVLRGVAFLEAKREDASDTYPSIDISQLERIYNNAPYAQLLLYLHSCIPLPVKFPDDSEWHSHMYVSPLNTVIPKLRQLRPVHYGRVLRVSLPLAMQITSRYFWGHDLDYRKDVIDKVIAGVDEYKTKFTAVVNVHYENQSPVNLDLSPEVWEPIK